MAANFWQLQKQAKSKTSLYVSLFVLLCFLASFCAEILARVALSETYVNPPLPYVGVGFFVLTILVAGFNYLNFLQSGGRVVAETMGGKLIHGYTNNPKERQLLNIVEELSIATSLPIPPVYLIPAQEINAFAAGTSSENAVIGVTLGTLNLLNRDELQGVIAHEYSHIYHQDTKIGMRLAAMVMGFFIASYLGLRLLGNMAYFRTERDDRKGGDPVMAIALIFLLVGAFTWFFGSILQATVSRQRELLADAAAIQYTRNPSGLANALRKIGAMHIADMPKSGKAFAHLYFNEKASFWSRLFATHPPLEERIALIEGRKMKD